jgi:tetratricopeptide (TPR) repeat protein
MRIPLVLIALSFGAPVMAQVSTYGACMDLVARDPARAEAEAEKWERLGDGGAAAGHCGAMALAAQGANRAAARKLADLAAQPASAPLATRAEMFEQAAGLWLDAGDVGLARAALDQGLILTPDAPSLLAARASAHAAAGEHRAAIADLDRALRAQPNDSGLLALRAAAWRNSGDIPAALRDARAAVAADPGSAVALFERGAAQAALGEPAKAREDWLDAIAAEPGSPAADQARLSLQALDAP